MIQRHNRELSAGAERAVGLRAVTPHRPAYPVGRHAFADLIDSARRRRYAESRAGMACRRRTF